MTDAPDRSPQLPGAAPDQSPMLSGICPPHELRLLQAIRDSELAPQADVLMRQAKTSVRILPRRGEVPIGLSRFGGRPDLPEEWSWPTWDNSQWALRYAGSSNPTAPLDFIAQIRLDALPAHPDGLPRTGLLYFFHARDGPWGYDPTHGPGSRVLHYDGPTDALATVDMPANGATRPFHECALDFDLEATLPSSPADREGIDRDRWRELGNRIHPSKFHHLGGHPREIYEEMALQCQFASNGLTGRNDPRAAEIALGAGDWQLLLQVDTDGDGPGWIWGDYGKLYWWIRRQDLAALRFDRTWTILQFH